MRLQGAAQRLTIFIGESDHYQHHSLSSEIVQRAQRAGLAGCSVFRGVSGFGASRTLHTSHLLSLSEDLPLAIVIVDAAEHVQAFLPQLDELVTEGLVTIDDVEVVRYVGRAQPDPA
jgi:PII-like signaling protein